VHPSIPQIDAMLTIEPVPRAVMDRAAARVP
jgi:hypothetical protein